MYKIILVLIITMITSIFYAVNSINNNIRSINHNHLTILEGVTQ